MHVESKLRKPLITGGKTLNDVSDDISKRVEEKPSISWYIAMGIANITLAVGAYAVYRTLWDGIGMWGLNKTVMWAWDITNFVWWVGIGHAGTLISAILLLFRQRWRMSINRSAEAMTIFAVICFVYMMFILFFILIIPPLKSLISASNPNLQDFHKESNSNS